MRGATLMRRTALVGLAVLPVGAGSPSAAVAASSVDPYGVVVSVAGGLVASGMFTTDDQQTFAITAVIPGAYTFGTPPLRNVDMSHAWASAEDLTPPQTGPFSATVRCSSVANVSSWSVGHDTPDAPHIGTTESPLDGVAFDVSCPGIGYQFLRMQLDDWRGGLGQGGHTGQPWGAFDWQSQPEDSYGWSGGTVLGGSIVVRCAAREVAVMSLMGFDASGAPHVFPGFGMGTVDLDPSLTVAEG